MTTYIHHPSGLLVGSDGTIWKPTTHKQGKGKRGNYSTIRWNSRLLKVHQLVMESFEGPRPVGFCVHHKDGNSQNNALSNLMYIRNTSHVRGSMHGNSKLTEDEVHTIRSLSKTMRMSLIAKKLNLPYYLISDVLYGRAWSWLKSP